MVQFALAAFAALFVTIGPIPAAAVFATLTRHSDRAHQRRMAVKGVAIAALLLLVFGVLGDDLLRVLGIGIPAVRVGGGILLMLLSIGVVFGRESDGGDGEAAGAPHAAVQNPDIGVFPLAMPLIAGPGAITATVVLASEARNDIGTNLVLFAMLFLVLLVTLGCLLSVSGLQRVLGETGMSVIARILGILLTALSAQLILDGLRTSGIFRG